MSVSGGTGGPPRPPVTWRSLLVVVAIMVVVALVLLVGGRIAPSGPSGESLPNVAASRSASPRPTQQPSTQPSRDPETGLRWADLGSLPPQVAATVGLIERGGPFPYAKDGATFANFERVLPRQVRGFYREYTVVTPGSRDRGARRIVTGDQDRLFFYTGDHYASFVRIRR